MFVTTYKSSLCFNPYPPPRSPAAWRSIGPALTGSSSCQLQQRLLQLHLGGLDLPDPGLLEQVMAALTSLTLLHFHVSMKSPALQVRSSGGSQVETKV
jgi:hypothetical protein